MQITELMMAVIAIFLSHLLYNVTDTRLQHKHTVLLTKKMY